MHCCRRIQQSDGALWILLLQRDRSLDRGLGELETLRQDAFTASVNHDMSFFDEFQSGRIISRITSDTQEFSQVVLLVTDLVGQAAEWDRHLGEPAPLMEAPTIVSLALEGVLFGSHLASHRAASVGRYEAKRTVG